MKKVLLIFMFAHLGNPGSWAQVTEQWVARYNGPGSVRDRVEDIALDTIGNVYVTGRSVGSGTGFDFATIKYSSSGTSLWVSRYSHPANSSDLAFAIELDDSGNAYVTGHSWTGILSSTDYATIKYSSSGVSRWLREYNGPSSAGDEASDLSLDSLGNVYVTGWSWDSLTGYDYVTIKYSNAGDTLWLSRYDGPQNYTDQPRAIAVDNSGNVYVTGRSIGAGDEYDFATIKYDSSGVEVWVRRYDGPSNGESHATALVLDDLGNVCVTGKTWNGSNFDFATVKYSGSGTELWDRIYNGPSNGGDEANDIASDDSGNVFVTGGSEGDYATIKYNSGGGLLWIRSFNGGGNGTDLATALTLDDSGNVYVTGSTWNNNSFDYGTIKYSKTGDTLWVMQYDGPANGADTATAIVVDRAGNVYVTGTSMGIGSFFDYATIKYVPQSLYYDFGVIRILSPMDTVFPDSTYTPIARVKNFGNLILDSFDVIATINSYVDTQKIYLLPTGDSVNVVFQDWTVPPFDTTVYLCSICTNDSRDSNLINNCREKTIYAFSPIGMSEENLIHYPTGIRLFQNYPNPFNTVTSIRYQNPIVNPDSRFKNHVNLSIYDLSGRLVDILVDHLQVPGIYEVQWVGKNKRSGIYLFRLKITDQKESRLPAVTKKMLLLR